MDPNACWTAMADAVKDSDWEAAASHATDLLVWLSKDGFPPTITGIKQFDRLAAIATCARLSVEVE